MACAILIIPICLLTLPLGETVYCFHGPAKGPALDRNVCRADPPLDQGTAALRSTGDPAAASHRPPVWLPLLWRGPGPGCAHDPEHARDGHAACHHPEGACGIAGLQGTG